MTLTPEQQRLVEEASRWVPNCVKIFLQNMPCLREVANLCDLESAAYLACCKAAKTFDPTKGNMSAYFGVAIKNGILREIQTEMKTGSTSIYRISPQEAERRMAVTNKSRERVMESLLALTEEERRWIEMYVFDEASFRSIGRREGCDRRVAKKRVLTHIDKLRRACDDTP